MHNYAQKDANIVWNSSERFGAFLKHSDDVIILL